MATGMTLFVQRQDKNGAWHGVYTSANAYPWHDHILKTLTHVPINERTRIMETQIFGHKNLYMLIEGLTGHIGQTRQGKNPKPEHVIAKTMTLNDLEGSPLWTEWFNNLTKHDQHSPHIFTLADIDAWVTRTAHNLPSPHPWAWTRGPLLKEAKRFQSKILTLLEDQENHPELQRVLTGPAWGPGIGYDEECITPFPHDIPTRPKSAHEEVVTRHTVQNVRKTLLPIRPDTVRVLLTLDS